MVRFRPTYPQAVGRGVFVGGLVGTAAAVIIALALAAGLDRPGLPTWLAVATPLVVALLAGALLGMALGRDAGADVDDLGIQPVPAEQVPFLAWSSVHDLRVERRGGRKQVAVYLDTGQVSRLPAPYDGRLFAADPQFEQKLFMLRHLWETHRTFRLNHGQPGRDGGGPGYGGTG
jgi:hypothetical protein